MNGLKKVGQTQKKQGWEEKGYDRKRTKRKYDRNIRKNNKG